MGKTEKDIHIKQAGYRSGGKSKKLKIDSKYSVQLSQYVNQQKKFQNNLVISGSTIIKKNKPQ